MCVCLSRDIPVRKHWILNVQSFAPRLEPADVPAHLSPVGLRLVPGGGEGSAVRRVRRTVPAALHGRALGSVCRCKRSSATLPGCLWRKTPPFSPQSQRGAAQDASHVRLHRCCETLSHSLLLPVALSWSPLLLRVGKDGGVWGRAKGDEPSTRGCATIWTKLDSELDVLDAGGAPTYYQHTCLQQPLPELCDQTCDNVTL